MDNLTVWLDDPSHRAALQLQLEQATGDAWEDLVIGMLRARLAEDVVKQTLTTRFGNDTIKRAAVLEKLIDSLDVQRDLAQVVIDLIEHPALDALYVVNGKRSEISFRAAMCLSRLSDVPAQHRAGFRPLLQKLVQSGKNGESEAARQVLEAWK